MNERICDVCGRRFELGEFPRGEEAQRHHGIVEVARGRRIIYGAKIGITFRSHMRIWLNICDPCQPIAGAALERLYRDFSALLEAAKIEEIEYQKNAWEPVRVTDVAPDAEPGIVTRRKDVAT